VAIAFPYGAHPGRLALSDLAGTPTPCSWWSHTTL
jgi:hypothetical protein